jgi:Na+-driven multidrug efflux pump
LLVFLIGILFFLIGFISSEFIAFFLEKLTTKLDSETLELTKTYIKWQSFALPFQILTVTIYAILRVKKFIKTVLILDGLYL